MSDNIYDFDFAESATKDILQIRKYLKDSLKNEQAKRNFETELNKTIDDICAMPTAFSECQAPLLSRKKMRFTLVGDYKVYFIFKTKIKMVYILFVKHAKQNVGHRANYN
ncbi:MAG: type II toxin-antitoxin system RelE/ParE family toxin [Clostridia bacterium]|nr:type II toxin-antitoxin system RelE/ParE family toxin [Clostridia bacterium]